MNEGVEVLENGNRKITIRYEALAYPPVWISVTVDSEGVIVDIHNAVGKSMMNILNTQDHMLLARLSSLVSNFPVTVSVQSNKTVEPSDPIHVGDCAHSVVVSQTRIALHPRAKGVLGYILSDLECIECGTKFKVCLSCSDSLGHTLVHQENTVANALDNFVPSKTDQIH